MKSIMNYQVVPIGMTSEIRNPRTIHGSLEPTERLILYAMGSGGVPVGDRVRLQKLVFLTARSLPSILGDAFDFEPHKKGPYSKDIDETVLDFIGGGLVEPERLCMTPLGREVYDIVEGEIKEPLRGTVDFWKDFEDGLAEDELLTYVYGTSPETVGNSEVAERIRRDRVKNTVSLVRKEKITASKGAEILGMSPLGFEDVLRDWKVRWKS